MPIQFGSQQWRDEFNSNLANQMGSNGLLTKPTVPKTSTAPPTNGMAADGGQLKPTSVKPSAPKPATSPTTATATPKPSGNDLWASMTEDQRIAHSLRHGTDYARKQGITSAPKPAPAPTTTSTRSPAPATNGMGSDGRQLGAVANAGTTQRSPTPHEIQQQGADPVKFYDMNTPIMELQNVKPMPVAGGGYDFVKTYMGNTGSLTPQAWNRILELHANGFTSGADYKFVQEQMASKDHSPEFHAQILDAHRQRTGEIVNDPWTLTNQPDQNGMGVDGSQRNPSNTAPNDPNDAGSWQGSGSHDEGGNVVPGGGADPNRPTPDAVVPKAPIVGGVGDIGNGGGAGGNNGNGTVPPSTGTIPTTGDGEGGGNNPTPVTDYASNLVDRQTLAEGAEFVEQGFTFDPDSMTVAGQMTGLLQGDSPYIQQARLRAQREAANRGLNSSTMAVQSGEEAAIAQAMPIAQQDASTYYDRAKTRYGVTNEAAMQAARAGQDRLSMRDQFGYNAALADQDYGIRSQLAAQQQMFNQSNMDKEQQQVLERMAVEIDAKVAERMDNINAQLRANYGQAQERTAERVSAEIQAIYQNPELDAAAQNRAIQNVYDRWQADVDFIDQVYGAQNTGAVGEVDDGEAFSPEDITTPNSSTPDSYFENMTPEQREQMINYLEQLDPAQRSQILQANPALAAFISTL